MKKDLIFAPILVAISVVLFLLRATGLTAHIIVSVIGALVLVAYTVLCKKEWKIPALEIGERVAYGIALITGIVLKIVYVMAVAIIHKIFAVLFLVALIVALAHKLITLKK